MQESKLQEEEWNRIKEELKAELTAEMKGELGKKTKIKKIPKEKNAPNMLQKSVLVEVASLLVGMVLLSLFTYNMLFDFQLLERYVNLLIILLLVLLTIPTIVAGGFWKDFTRVLSRYQPDGGWKLYELKRSLDAIELLQKQLCYAAVLIVMFQLIGVLYNMSEPSALGPGIANILLTGLYTAIMELLLMPLKITVKKQIADYMEEA